MTVRSFAQRIAPGVCGFGMLAYCPPTPTPAVPTVPVSAFCSILEAESFTGPRLVEVNSGERIDATTNNHFNRFHDISGPRTNPFIFNNSDLIAVDEVWMHRSPVAVVRAAVHTANHTGTTDGTGHAWTIQSQDAAGAWSAPFAQGSPIGPNEVDDPKTAGASVPQLLTVGSATAQVFACTSGRTDDNTGRTTWLQEVTPPSTATSAGGMVMPIQDVLYGDDHFLPNAPGPLRGPSRPPTPNVHGPGDLTHTGAVKCAMTQVGDNVSTRELHLIVVANGVLYHSMYSNFNIATNESGSTSMRFCNVSPWASVTQALGGTFGDVVSASIVASRQNAISIFFVAKAGAQFTQYKTYHAVRFSANGGSWRPVDDVLALRDGAGAIPGFTPYNVAVGMCPAYPETPMDQGDEITYVQWDDKSFAQVGRVISTPRLWQSTNVTGVYSPATPLVGVIRGVDPARDFTIPHWSIGARPFGASAKPPTP